VLGRGVRVNDFAHVEDSIIFDNCIVGRRAKVKRAILDKNVVVPDGTLIGYDADSDRKLYHVTESGIVVVEGRRSAVDVASLIV
jgi:glucose-1-phosphate adenylyltransferase